jgi:hypothetical protein
LPGAGCSRTATTHTSHALHGVRHAALFRLSDYLLFTARLFNSACGAATLAILFAVTFHLFRDYGRCAPYIIAASATAAVMFNPIFAFTSGKAWNQDLPTFLTLVALLCLWGWRKAASLADDRGWRAALWIAAAGALFGLAVGIRLTFAPAAVAFVLAIVFACPPAGHQVRAVVIFCAAAAAALLPAWWLLALAPRPPSAVFLSFEHHLEKPLRSQALHLKLTPLVLSDPTEPARKFELWCRSDIHAPPHRRHHRHATTTAAAASRSTR